MVRLKNENGPENTPQRPRVAQAPAVVLLDVGCQTIALPQLVKLSHPQVITRWSKSLIIGFVPLIFHSSY